MKASELRIGNFVQSKANGISIIQQIGSTLNENYVGGRSLGGNYWENSYLPIPLTEEWLLRLGFMITGGFKKNAERYVIQDGRSVAYVVQKEGEDGYDVMAERGRYYNYIATVEYVHQLQNLFFALTGEEL